MKEIKACENLTDEYTYSLNASDGNIFLNFKNSRVFFKSYLIFKNGYPNDEIYCLQKEFVNSNLKSSILYHINNSSWIDDLKAINQIHPKHKDELFDNNKHFIIFFQDETFECIADSYEVQYFDGE